MNSAVVAFHDRVFFGVQARNSSGVEDLSAVHVLLGDDVFAGTRDARCLRAQLCDENKLCRHERYQKRLAKELREVKTAVKG